jgi:hypothetical protein
VKMYLKVRDAATCCGVTSGSYVHLPNGSEDTQ